jgi:phage terminase large subunit
MTSSRTASSAPKTAGCGKNDGSTLNNPKKARQYGSAIKIRGTPNAKQQLFFDSHTKYTAYGGARGGGKSWALRRKLVALCLRYPGIHCLLLRRSYPELKTNHLIPMLCEYGALFEYREGEKLLEMKNGSRIDLGYCACDRDALRYQGQEYDIIAVDEATQLSEYQFSLISASLRGVGDYPRRIYLTCNPGGVGHAWVKRLFIDRVYRPGERPEDYSFIQALVYDNDVLQAADPGYVRQLEALPARLKDAWLHGRWDVFEGQFFAEFDESVHVFDADPEKGAATENAAVIPNNLRRFVALDYGFDMLAALTVGVDSRSDLWVLGECCAPGLTLGEAAERVVKMISGQEIEYAVASPDLWNRRQDSGKSGFEIMQATPGMPPMRPADNRRIPGWRVLREYLAAPSALRRTDEERRPALHISRRCGNLISSMQSLLCDREKPEDAADEPHAATHAPEALRYAVMSRAQAPESEKSPFTFRRGINLYDI